MTDPAMTFEAVFDGHEPQTFLTLQSAMAWAEGIDSPTGTIAFDGQGIVRYVSGYIEVV